MWDDILLELRRLTHSHAQQMFLNETVWLFDVTRHPAWTPTSYPFSCRATVSKWNSLNISCHKTSCLNSDVLPILMQSKRFYMKQFDYLMSQNILDELRRSSHSHAEQTFPNETVWLFHVTIKTSSLNSDVLPILMQSKHLQMKTSGSLNYSLRQFSEGIRTSGTNSLTGKGLSHSLDNWMIKSPVSRSARAERSRGCIGTGH